MAAETKGEILTVSADPKYSDQKPGTSGLRKKVSVVKQKNYLENFVQSIFNCLPDIKGKELVVSGDGRFYNDQAAQLIIRMACANGVGRVVLGKNLLMTTPSVSAVVRNRKSFGAIILTASHNPGGPNADFGIKYNSANGGPAPDKLTSQIFEQTKALTNYVIMSDQPSFKVDTVGVYKYHNMEIEVIDATAEYSKLMSKLFDFPRLQAFLSRPDFSFVIDSMHGVSGPFAHRLFVEDLKAPSSCLLNATPLPDFGGGHPDPNLTYAEELVKRLHIFDTSAADASVPDFGAACDGDADRNMILGRKFFVTPSDSVAIITSYATKAIPYFKDGLLGVARSMPTSQALDRVAAKLGIQCYEVPTGWKYFGNLMDADKLSICGEESFGTGSNIVREKDGLWAILAWLSILEYRNRDKAVGSGLVSIKDIVEEHWKEYGRNFYTRYDYEEVDSKHANDVVSHLRSLIADTKLANQVISAAAAEAKADPSAYVLAKADEFEYTDPVDGSVAKEQGLRFLFASGSRFVLRLSGTGSSGATIRLYIEQYTDDQALIHQAPKDALAPLIKIALSVSKIAEFTHRDAPTVIT